MSYSEYHNKEKQREATRRYREKHKEEVKEKDRIAQAERRRQLADDPEYRAKCREWSKKSARKRRLDPEVRERERIASKEYQQERRSQDRQKFNEECKAYMRPKYTELRNAVHNKLGNRCSICGYDKDSRALQIDHIDGKGRRERMRLGWYKFFNKILKDPTGYQLLDANCNYIKRYENNEVTIVDPELRTNKNAGVPS